MQSAFFDSQELGRFASSIIAAVIPYAQGEGHPEVKRKVSIKIKYSSSTGGGEGRRYPKSGLGTGVPPPLARTGVRGYPSQVRR